MSSALLATGDWLTWVVLAAFVIVIVVFFVLSSRRNKKKQQEAEDLMNAVKPGNKVKTIGGVCGIVVEVDPAENTFVLETGSEQSGKCYLKFDKQAIYQTDAVVEKSAPADEKESDKDKDKETEKDFSAETAEEASAEEKVPEENVSEKGSSEEKTSSKK